MFQVLPSVTFVVLIATLGLTRELREATEEEVEEAEVEEVESSVLIRFDGIAAEVSSEVEAGLFSPGEASCKRISL